MPNSEAKMDAMTCDSPQSRIGHLPLQRAWQLLGLGVVAAASVLTVVSSRAMDAFKSYKLIPTDLPLHSLKSLSSSLVVFLLVSSVPMFRQHRLLASEFGWRSWTACCALLAVPTSFVLISWHDIVEVIDVSTGGFGPNTRALRLVSGATVLVPAFIYFLGLWAALQLKAAADTDRLRSRLRQRARHD
jgi:hypothetical protein